MKTIVCFGDSNTFGYRPEDGGRYPPEVRWTGILRENLKEKGYEVIEEGLVGRTTVFEDSVRPGRKGIDFLVPLIETHAPVDTVILMLGTNDCKSLYKASPQVIGKGMERLIRQIQNFHSEIKILLMSPIHLGEEVYREEFDPEFDQESVKTSKKLKEVYEKLARQYGCDFLAASDIAKPSKEDQEHMAAEGHRALAKAVTEKFEKKSA